MAAMKVVVKLDVHDGRRKHKAIKAVSALCGIDQIVVDMKDDKMTVVGMVDPVDVVRKLRKAFCTVYMVSVGPAKEEEEESTKEVNTKDASKLVPVPVYLPWYPPPHQPHPCYCYLVHSEEEPSECVIC